MPKLRDYFGSDINTFINTDEFAGEIDIDGNNVTVVMDIDTLKEMQLKNGGEGLASSELLFHVAKSELQFKPFVGQDLLVNGDLYYINDAKEDEGIFTITLGAPKA